MTGNREEVPRVSALLSDEARRGWDKVCSANRITLSGLLEALGLELDEHPDVLLQRAIDRAAEVDRERHNRP